MDSRDPFSTSSSMTVTRDSGSAADDDGVLSVTATLSKESAVLFQSGKYAECVDVLTQLLQKKEADPKVLHNIALVEFLRDGCSEPKKLLQALINLKKKCEDLARASGEQLDNASGNRTTSGLKTNSTGHQVSGAGPNIVFSEELDVSLTTLNMAITLYHLQDYSKAMSLLEILFQNIEPLDEAIALHVCLLLLDIAVDTRDAAKLAEVVNYVEKAFGVSHINNQSDNGSMGQHQPSNLVSKSSSIPSNVTATDEMNSDSAATASDNTLSRTLSDEAIDYDNLFSSLEITVGGVKKYQKHSLLSASNDLSRSEKYSFVDLKLKVPLYKVQLLLLIRNLKVAKRELKLAMNIARGRDSSSALLLKSQLELARGNYVKAEKLLKASHNQQETGNSIIFDNNMGCIFFQWGKFNTAGVFFCKALVGCSSLRKEKPRNLTSFSQDKTLLILYNSGLQYLACGKPVVAAQCLQKASLIFCKRPLFWIRLAECCLMALEKGMAKSFEVAVIGQGKWRHLAIISEPSVTGHILISEVGKPNSGRKEGQDLSMSFARQCLWNALELVRRFESKPFKSGTSLKPGSVENEPSEGVTSSKNLNHRNPSSNTDSKGGSKDNVSLGQVSANGDTKEQKGGSNFSFAEYEDVCRREYCTMKQAILADLAFVELELGNPLVTLTWARSLLQIPECCKMYSFLARVYAAEALCLLNRPKEAAEQISVYFAGANVELPYSRDDCEHWLSQWQGNKLMDTEELNTGSGPLKGRGAEEWHDSLFRKPEQGRGALYVNLAAMCAMQGELEQACQYSAKALSILPNCREANLMGVYLDLKQGKIGEALSRLRSCNCVRFVSSGGLKSKGSS